MNTVHIVIGASCSGKSTFVNNSFINGSKLNFYKDVIGITECDNYYLIGDYTSKTVDGRIRGTDSTARQYIKFVVCQIERLIDKKSVVMDGDKIYSHNIFNALLAKNIPVKLYYMWCSVDTSLLRNKNNGSTMKESAIKALHTKPYNFYMEYRDKVDTVVYNTEEITDWNKFDKNTVTAFPVELKDTRIRLLR